jgi:hypothetical protein
LQGDLSQEELEKAGITPEEAAEAAQKLFAEVQIPFSATAIFYVDAPEPCYMLDCSRQVNGANLTTAGEGVGGGLNPFWGYEKMSLFVSKEGVVYLYWYSPYEVMETTVENATLKPFEDIEDIFYTMMKTIYQPAAKEENGTTIKVSYVSLQLQRIKLSEDNSEGLLIPVWCFYGTRYVDESIPNDGTAGGCLLTTTPRQARETVEQLIAETGLDDMVIDRVALYSSKDQLPDGLLEEMERQGMDTTGLASDEPETQAYVVRLVRQLSGVKVESTHDSSETGIDSASYSKEWWYESLTVSVDDKGIANLFWTGPLNVTEVLTEDTAILPWSDIESVYERMMPVQNAAFFDYESEVRIDITRVSLSLQRIMERDSFTAGLVVPVWNFYGTITMTKKLSEEGEGIAFVQDMGYIPLMSINAIDGSIIDVRQGY